MRTKKILTMAMALFLLISILPIAALAAETDPTLTVNVSAIATGGYDSEATLKAEVYEEGTVFKVDDVFYVPVVLTNMESFDAAGLKMTYDADVFEFLEFKTSFSREVEFEGETITSSFAKTLFSNDNLDLTPNASTLIVYSSTGNAVVNDDTGYLFFAGFKVIGKSSTGKETIGIQSAGEYQGITMTDVTYDAINYVAGTVNVEKDEIASALSFKDGEATYEFDTLKADNYTLIAPDVSYHFAGWFSGLTADGAMITTDAQGRYILSDKATADGTSFNATECRPKYDEKPESGAYNALWIHEDAETLSAMTLEVYETSFKYRKVTYTVDTEALSNNEAIRLAWKNTAGNGRVKLVKDMKVSGLGYYSISGTGYNNGAGYITLPLKLDMNGCKLTAVDRYDAALYFHTGTSGNALESSYGQGCVEHTYFGNYYTSLYIVEATGASFDAIRDVDLICNNTVSATKGLYCSRSTIGKMEHVSITLSTTGAQANISNTAAIYGENAASRGTTFGSIDNCTFSSDGYLILVESSTGNTVANLGTVTDCTMTATGTAVTSPVYLKGGQITFGAGNEVTADSSGLFAGTIATGENGTLDFVPGFTVNFYSYDGTKLLWADRYETGETPTAHLLTYSVVGVETYEHLGWSTTLGGSDLVDLTSLTADTTLYAVREAATLPAVVSMAQNGGEAVEYASWDLAMDAVDYYAKAEIKLLDDVEVSEPLSSDQSYTLDLNGHTLTYTGSSPLYETMYQSDQSYFTLTSSAAQKGTFVIAQGAKGIVLLHTRTGIVCPVTIENVKIVANGMAAETGWNKNGAPITIQNGHNTYTVTETLTMTNVEIEAANCPAVEFGIGQAAVTSKIQATFTNVKLSGNPVVVAVKSNNIPGTNHVFLTVDAASTFKGATNTYPIQETNGDFGLTPTYPEGYTLTAGADGWYSFEIPHICDYTILKSDETGHWYECGEKQSENVTAHTDTNIEDHKCDVCEYVMSTCNFEDGICTICGEAEQPNITVTNPKNGKTVNDEIVAAENGGYTLTLSCEDTTMTYVYLVKYTDADGVVSGKQKNTSGKYSDGDFAVPGGTMAIMVECALAGDANLNGSINALDVTQIRKYLAETQTFTELQLHAADANQNSSVNALDVTRIRKYLAKEFEKF
ncbi:MAG: hypothetical protein IJN67_03035 [Oscillospiraceae bacterium]|nr:hypothetical protein [Oscillospiraceae bacterium]